MPKTKRKTKTKKKPKVLKVKAPVVLTEDTKWKKEWDNLQVQILFAKVRRNRRELSKTYGKSFDDWYNKVSKTDIVKAGTKDLQNVLKGIRKFNNLKRKPKQIVAPPTDYKKHPNYISPDKLAKMLRDNRPKETPEQIRDRLRVNYKAPLTDAQMFLIATTSKDLDNPKYMGLELNLHNQWRFKNYLRKNNGYLQWKQKIARIKKMREHIEKPFDAVRKIRKQYEDIGKRLRTSGFISEKLFLEELQRNFGTSNVQSQNSYRTHDDKLIRPDVTINTPEGEKHFDIKTNKLVEVSDKIKSKKTSVVEGHGLNSYLDDHNIKDILEFPEHYLKSKKNNKEGKAQHKYDYIVADYAEAMALAKSCKLNHVDFFDAICETIRKKKSALVKERDFSSGVAIQELITLYDNKVASNQKSGKAKYKQADLFRSKDFKDWENRHNFSHYFDTYKKFNHFWKQFVEPAMATAKKIN